MMDMFEQSGGATGEVVFKLKNAHGVGSEYHAKLRPRVLEWVETYQCSAQKQRQIWAVLWEALQNAIKYGSTRGDLIHVRLKPGHNHTFNVEIVQPEAWPLWRDMLGKQKQLTMRDNQDLALGGTTLMIRLTSRIEVSDKGRTLLLFFAC